MSIIIPRRFDAFFCWFIPLWLTGFVLLYRNKPPEKLNYFAVGIFVAVVLAMLYRWLWNLGGREELDFNADVFRYRRVLFGLVRTRIFAMNEIAGLRFVGSVKRGKGWTPSGIAFSYRGRQFKVGDDLIQAEAKAIASAINQEFPE